MGRREELLLELERLNQAQNCPKADISVCICAGNAWRTINPVLEALWVQGLLVDLITSSDEKARDPTKVILKECGEWMTTHRSKAINRYIYMGEYPHRDRLDNLQAHARRAMLEEVLTDYVFFLDADVLLDPGTLRRACNIADGEPDGWGALCVQYNHRVDHEQWGATLMKTQVAKDVGFDGREFCGCVNLKRDLKAKGLEMKHIEGITAQHLKWGAVRTVVTGG